jgi:hypothetical protein
MVFNVKHSSPDCVSVIVFVGRITIEIFKLYSEGVHEGIKAAIAEGLEDAPCLKKGHAMGTMSNRN